jgi:hypothetical protein
MVSCKVGREYQKADWKAHKRSVPKTPLKQFQQLPFLWSKCQEPAKGLSGGINKPFNRLEART